MCATCLRSENASLLYIPGRMKDEGIEEMMTIRHKVAGGKNIRNAERVHSLFKVLAVIENSRFLQLNPVAITNSHHAGNTKQQPNWLVNP